ncbi:MAG: penicillin-insensitive murein endopeptidase, partial [Bdellovibrionales bacterium]|nr:penicillin-insensitive murein endopeptidase [Bdellovibrionales bacterium]
AIFLGMALVSCSPHQSRSYLDRQVFSKGKANSQEDAPLGFETSAPDRSMVADGIDSSPGTWGDGESDSVDSVENDSSSQVKGDSSPTPSTSVARTAGENPASNRTTTTASQVDQKNIELKPFVVPDIIRSRLDDDDQRKSVDKEPLQVTNAHLLIDLKTNQMKLDLSFDLKGRSAQFELIGDFDRNAENGRWESTLYASKSSLNPEMSAEELKEKKTIQAVVQCNRKFICSTTWLKLFYNDGTKLYEEDLVDGEEKPKVVISDNVSLALDPDQNGYMRIPNLSKLDERESDGPSEDDETNDTNPSEEPTELVRVADLPVTISAPPKLRPEPSRYTVKGLSTTQSKWREQATGRYDRGRLVKGTQLPASGAGWERRANSAAGTWGTDFTLDLLFKAAKSTMDIITGGNPLIINAISKRSGGHFDRHASHQNGLDVDARYFHEQANFRNRFNPVSNSTGFQNFKFDKNMAFLESLHSIDKNSRGQGKSHVLWVFTNREIKRRMCARYRNEHDGELPKEGTPGYMVLRYLIHISGHADHMHIRFRCPPGTSDCNEQIWPPSYQGTGCP